jgi:hypothetical protein
MASLPSCLERTFRPGPTTKLTRLAMGSRNIFTS